MSAEGTDYYDAVLTGINAPVTPTNVARLVAWQKAEGGHAANNALNTTQPEPGATAYNSNGGYPVKNYPNEATGIKATIKTLLNGHYSGIVKGLQADSPTTFDPANDAEIRTWGTDPNVIRQALGTTDANSVPSTSPSDTGTVKTVGGTTVGKPSSATASKAVIQDDGSISSNLMRFTVYGVAALAGAALVVGGAWRGLQPARDKVNAVKDNLQAKGAEAAKTAAVIA